MTTSFAAAARIARPTPPAAPKAAAPTKAESSPERIAGGESPGSVYHDETRPWWDLVSADTVEKAIADELFQAYVRLVVALA